MFKLIKIALGVAAIGMIITHREAIMARLKGEPMPEGACGAYKAKA